MGLTEKIEEEEVSVLHVEDDFLIAKYVKHSILTDQDAAPRGPYKYRLANATSIAEAREQLTHGDFDVVLLDLSLPDTTGYGFEELNKLASDFPYVPIIILSNFSEDLAEKALEHGAQDFINKGRLNFHELDRSIRYSMARCRRNFHIPEAPESVPDKDKIIYDVRSLRELRKKLGKICERRGNADGS